MRELISLPAVIACAQRCGQTPEEIVDLVAQIKVDWSWDDSPAKNELEDAIQKGFRVLPTWLGKNGNDLLAWCTRCKKYHRHGAGGQGLAGGGWREPHCMDSSGGCYYLEILGRVSDAIDQDARSRRPKGPKFN